MALRDTLLPFSHSKTLWEVSSVAALFGIYSLLPIWKDHSPYAEIADFPSGLHAALSVVVGWLLVFRTNTAYARWWEARTLWGALVNASRNTSVKLSRLVQLPNEERQQVKRLLSYFPFALRDHLRNEGNLDDMPEMKDEPTIQHIPSIIIARLYERVKIWKAARWIDGDELRVIDAELARFLDICGACERIQRTPIVRSYRYFTRQCVMLLLLTFPWGISNDFGWWTIPLTMLTAYFMVGLETVAEHVEEPFGRDEDDLDLDGLCLTIEKSVQQIIATDSAA
jgi:putative membrane protein